MFANWPDRIIGGVSKRAFDIVAASVLLAFFTPVLAVTAFLVWIQDGGPPLFLHQRVGVGGRFFRCIKFRSMARNGEEVLQRHFVANPPARAEWIRTQKLTKDPRITALGAFLRKTSIDEFPQLINVIRGDMSLVGPRPVVPDELGRYDLDRVHYLRARPGLTGLWQVSGRSTTTYAKRVALDKNYSLRWSFLRDIEILVRTVPAVLLVRGAV